MAGGVQFYGIQKVMEMFDARAVDAWSIWHGKEYLFKGHGNGELNTILESLKNSFNDPIYTLKVYEGLDSADKIKSNTPHDGSFNFKINIPMEVQGMGYISGNGNYQLVKRIEELEKKNLQLEAELTQEDNEPETIGSVVDAVIIDLIKDPAKAKSWLDIIKEIFTPNKPAAIILRPLPAAVGNIQEAPLTELTNDEKSNRLIVALDALEKADPKILDHLEKLAGIATRSPAQFKILIGMLETMK